MSSNATATVVRTGSGTRFVIYTLLALFSLFYLLPLYVMVVNSLKPLSEIQAGGLDSKKSAQTSGHMQILSYEFRGSR